MERKDVERKMIDMGFYVGNKGFGYIEDVLEIIEADGGYVEKITDTYAIVGKKNKQKWERVERCIRHEIDCYYNHAKVHPILENSCSIRHRFTNKEFLARLYRIIYLGLGEGQKKPQVPHGILWEDEE